MHHPSANNSASFRKREQPYHSYCRLEVWIIEQLVWNLIGHPSRCCPGAAL
jgi:hypothetical protein